MAINRRIFKTDEHALIATTLGCIANVFYSQGRYEDALSNYEKSLAIYRRMFGKDEHALIATILHNIAQVYDSQGRYEDALSNFEK